jgi:hypothetical protein
MLKLNIKWEYETGEVFEDWTRPFEVAAAEQSLYKGTSIIKVLGDQDLPSSELLLFLAHKIANRIDQPQNYEKFSKRVVDVQMVGYQFPKAFEPEASDA